MSAIAGITFGKTPCLITDTAAYTIDGTLIGFYSKVATLPHMRAAIAIRGSSLLPGLFAGLISQRFTTFDDFIEKGGWFLEPTFEQLAPALGSNEYQRFEMTVVGWSESRDAAECYQMVNYVPPENIGRVEEWQFFRFDDGVIAPSPTADDFIAAGMPQDEHFDIRRDFDPHRDAIWLGEAMRRHRWHVEQGGSMKDAVAPVGGQIIVTCVTRDGITQRAVHDWKDRLGEPIKPNFAPADIKTNVSALPLNRQQRRAMERQNSRRH